MKYMRFIVMFGITIVLALIMIFYNPNKKYLAVYKNEMTIYYNIEEEGYSWSYKISDDNLKETKSENLSWTFIPVKDGEVTLTYYFKKDNSEEEYKYKIDYTFKIEGKKIIWTNGYANGLLNYPNPK